MIDSPACVENTLPANDDGSSSRVDMPFSINFYGSTYSTLWVNNNGNVTFDGPLSTYTPFGLLATNHPIIAPFFADVDTRGTGSSPVQYGYGTTVYEGHAAICVLAVNVSWPGSDVVTTLTSPSGVVYTRDNPQGADHGSGPTSEYFQIGTPEQGEWTVSLYGADVDAAGEPVTFDAYDVPASNHAPHAEFTVTGSGRTFRFDANTSSDADGSISGYEWDFGDGTTATGKTVEHTYAFDGSFAPVLEVIDDDDASTFRQATANVVVQATPPTAYSGSSLRLTNSVKTTGEGADVVVVGDVECNSNAIVGGDLVATGNVHLTNSCHVEGDVRAGGAVTLNSTPTVGGSIEAVGDVSVQSSALIGGDVRTAGNVIYTDGRATSVTTGEPAISGTIEDKAEVSAPTLTTPEQPEADPTATPRTWTSWLNTTAAANGAPSWSRGLSANPGCTLAPWAASVNGPTASIETATMIDARSSATGCSSITIQDMTLELGADLTVFADAFNSPGNLAVTSIDGQPHTLRVVVPGPIAGCSTAGTLRFSGATTTTNGARLEAFTPGKLAVNGPSTIDGMLHAGCVSASGAVSVTTSER